MVSPREEDRRALARVPGISDDEAADDIHPVAVQVIDRGEGRVAHRLTVSPFPVLGRGAQGLEVLLQVGVGGV